MTMKVKATHIIELRNRKAWSQQQLADISSLSLRTVQRIENTAQASHESIQSIAAAFDIDVSELLAVKANAVEPAKAINKQILISSVIGFCIAFVIAFYWTTEKNQHMATEEMTITADKQSMQDNVTVFEGAVRITIPEHYKAQILSDELSVVGQSGIFEGDVSVLVNDSTIKLQQAVVQKSPSGFSIDANRAEITKSSK